MIIAFTGHRPNKLPDGYGTNAPITNAIKEKLIDIAPDCCISGMALGVDQIAAKICVELSIPFLAAIPFAGQESLWPDQSKEEYKRLLDKAAFVHIVSEGQYAAYKMQIRNCWMVDRCDLLLAVWDGTNGGTRNCVEYAQSIDKDILILNPISCEWSMPR